MNWVKCGMLLSACLVSWWAAAASVECALPVFPPECKTMTDPQTGAELTFLTTAPSRDTNLYFHERSWLSDESMILFNSDRAEGGLMGYLTATGELVRFVTPEGGLGSGTAGARNNCVYAVRGGDVVEVAMQIDASKDPAVRSKVLAKIRTICSLPKGVHIVGLNPSCDGRRLACGIDGGEQKLPIELLAIDIKSGKTKVVCTLPTPPGYGGHVQWSHTNPNLLSFAGLGQRLWIVDIRKGTPWNPYIQQPDELVTHESWWVDDQMLFCGGVHPKPTEDSHVKVLNIKTGEVRIIGEGCWWPEATSEQLAKRNWWHAAGSDDGRWVVADNWHGDIMLFEGKTTRPHLLTGGHRTYGHGDHPHVGWDRLGKQVVFTSGLLGDSNVCVATIPDALQKGLDQ